MAIHKVFLLLLFSSACLSAPVKKHDAQLEASSRSIQKCLTTCLKGEPRQICFDEGIHDARPAPIVPEHVCKVTDCVVSNITCPSNKTTLPFQCLMTTRAILKQVNANERESVCNVPIRRMEFCLFSPAPGRVSDFSHGQEVTFDVRRRGSSKLKSKTCLCYNGRWISRNAIYSGTSVKKTRIFCHVNNSRNPKYLRTKNVMEPAFPKNGVIAKLLSEHLRIER